MAQRAPSDAGPQQADPSSFWETNFSLIGFRCQPLLANIDESLNLGSPFAPNRGMLPLEHEYHGDAAYPIYSNRIRQHQQRV